MKGDRVSIGDNQSHHFFTVTMEKVRQNDTDTYWCGISKSGPDLGAPIRVTIEPGENFLMYTVRPSCSGQKD